MRVLIVDDSLVCRSALRAVLEADPELEVVGEASDGLEVIARIESLRPSLVLLDLQMPRMGGLETLDWIMRNRPTPIVLITDRPEHQSVDQTFAALSRGALDLIPKSSGWRAASPEARVLLTRLKTLVRESEARRMASSSGRSGPVTPPPVRPPGWVPSLVGIGASTGGPAALATLLRGVPRDFPAPVVIVQHMDPEFQDGFAAWLSRHTGHEVKVAQDGERLAPGAIRVARSGFDVVVRRGLRLELQKPQPGTLHSPSVDKLFVSMADALADACVGLLLTGMGRDGAAGMQALRARGALTVAQDRDSSVIYGMPRAAVELGAVELVLPLGRMAGWLSHFSRDVVPKGEVGLSPKILMVDDSPVVLEAGRMLLEDAGYEVVTLDNPLSVAAVMRSELPDLVLLDVNMPAVSGDVVAKIVSQHGLMKKTPVVLYSDRPADELKTRADACGAAGFLQKTEDEDAFLDGVRRFVSPGR